MKETLSNLIVVVFLLLAAAPVALAQQEKGELFTVTAQSRYISSSTVDDLNGEIKMAESKFKLTYGYSLWNLLPVSVGLNMKHTDIDENFESEYPSHLEGRSLEVGTKFPLPFIGPDYYMGVDVFPSFYTDDWQWESSAFRVPFRTFVIYKPADNFIFVAGVNVRIDYDNVVLPLIGFIYKPNDRLSFNLASDSPNIVYKLSDQFTIFGEFDYAWDEYEVTKNGQKGVVLKFKESSAGAGIKYTPTEFLEASVSAGEMLSRQLVYKDGSDKIEPDAAPYLKAKLELKF